MLKKIKKIRNILFILIIFLFIIFILSRGRVYDKSQLSYGVTFSQKHAADLGLNWREIYLSLLDDLGVRKLRLPIYWDEAEKTPEHYTWEDMDWQIKQADKRQVELIIAMGGRLPRWPECHFPAWLKGKTKQEIQLKTLDYLEEVIKRYKNNQAITAWQVENEPFLSHFGDCPKFDKEFLDQEIALVRSLDQRPIIVTDSGELSLWIPAAKRADIFGTTMYLDTYSKNLRRYIHYPILPSFFHFKKNLTRLFARPKDWIVIELQAEPWGPIPYQNLSQAERDRTMNLAKFKDMLEFARLSGFREFYLWGVEWWYWEMQHGRPGMWREARKLFVQKNFK